MGSTPRSSGCVTHSATPADEPRFVETVPKRGYRFIAPLQGDARSDLGQPQPSGDMASVAALKSLRRRRYSWVAAAAGLVIGAIGLSRAIATREAVTPAAPAMQFPLDTPEGRLSTIELSPDGRRLAVVAYHESLAPGDVPMEQALWVRRLDAPGWKRVLLLDDSMWFAWTPDSQSLLYTESGELRVVDAASGESRLRARADGVKPLVAPDGSILLGGQRIQRFEPGSEVPIEVVAPNPALVWMFPTAVLPDGRLLVTQVSNDTRHDGVFVLATGTGPRRVLDAAAIVRITRKGRFLYGRDATIVSQAFDSTTGQLLGDPEAVVGDVARLGRLHAFTLGGDDTLVWRPKSNERVENQLIWFDRRGRRLGTVGEPAHYRQIELSPDDRQLVVQRDTTWNSLGVFDLTRRTLTPLKPEDPTSPLLDRYVVTADGQRFLGIVPVKSASVPQIAALLNWSERAAR